MNDSKTTFSQLSPVAIFTYKRLDTLEKVIESLKKCDLAEETDVYIFSDAAKKTIDADKINAVRTYLKTVKGFKTVNLTFSETNKGLATSIISGASEIIKQYGSIIVLEDDLVVSTNFLAYMNASLTQYKNDPKVFSISGYTVPIRPLDNYDYDNYFTLRSSSWGWATWMDRWETVDWEVMDYHEFIKDNAARKQFNAMGSDMTKMLSEQMEGKISSWAIRWCYHQFKTNQMTSYPLISKIKNIGFDGDATHTKGADERFKTPLDTSSITQFNFNPNPVLDKWFIKQFIAKYSIKTRAYYKIKNLLNI